MTTIFHKILACNTVAAIDNILENDIDTPRPVLEAELLLEIYESPDVDERHLIAARAIGDVHQEQLILDWMAKKDLIG